MFTLHSQQESLTDSYEVKWIKFQYHSSYTLIQLRGHFSKCYVRWTEVMQLQWDTLLILVIL
jgi:hypothetical protein